MSYLIYALTDPRTDAVRYIGKSVNGLDRPRAHTQPSILKSDRTHKGNWVRQLVKLGLTPKISVLEEASQPGDLPELEMFWIAQGRGLGWDLTNATKGGEGAAGRVVSQQLRDHLRQIHKGKCYHYTPCSPEKKAALSAKRTGMKLSSEWAANIGKSKAGIQHTAEHNAKISESLMGREVSSGTRAKIGKANAGRVHTDAFRDACRARMLGNKQSKESNEKRSASLKLAWAARKLEKETVK